MDGREPRRALNSDASNASNSRGNHDRSTRAGPQCVGPAPPATSCAERNADWPEPFTAGEFYDYTVAEIDRVNTTTVHVAIVTDGFPAAVSYSPDQWVTVVEEVKASR